MEELLKQLKILLDNGTITQDMYDLAVSKLESTAETSSVNEPPAGNESDDGNSAAEPSTNSEETNTDDETQNSNETDIDSSSAEDNSSENTGSESDSSNEVLPENNNNSDGQNNFETQVLDLLNSISSRVTNLENKATENNTEAKPKSDAPADSDYGAGVRTIFKK